MMIKYSLKCSKDHTYDAWFPSIDGFDKIKTRGLLKCEVCGTNAVEKNISAPSIRSSKSNESRHYEYVGENLASEVMAIHTGKAENRNLYGTATPDEISDLIDKGITVVTNDKVN